MHSYSTLSVSARSSGVTSIGASVWLVLILLAGCASPPRYFDARSRLEGPRKVAAEASAEHTRSLPMYERGSGRALGWNDLLRAVRWADVVIVGEEHDDAVGHALQRTLVEDAMTRDRRAALSLEMLERDEQNVLDDYLDGIIDAAALIKLTHSSAREGGDNGWERWYLPIIDAAKERGARVVAANAPRRYVRLAGRSGYQALRRLPEARRRLVALPLTDADDYRQRFRDVLMEMQESDDEPESEGSVHSAALSEEQLASMFRSQQVWDATMARSIAEARRAGASKVIHLVGQFHSDFDGGLVKEVRRRLPARSRVLVISMQRAWPDAIREQDRDRADIIIYTGDRVEESAEDHGDAGGAGAGDTAEEREDTDPDCEDADRTPARKGHATPADASDAARPPQQPSRVLLPRLIPH